MESIRTSLVEDDVDEVGSIRATLAAPGKAAVAVEHRGTLREAGSLASAGGLAVVVLDSDLPDESAIDSAGRLRAAAPDVSIVIVIVIDSDDDDDAVDRRSHPSAEDVFVKRRNDRTVLELSVRRSLERQVVRIAVEQKPRALVMQSSEGLAVVSRSGSVLFANVAAEEFVGASPGELRGQNLGFPFDACARKGLAVRHDRLLEVHGVESRWEQAPVWLVSRFDITKHEGERAELEALTARMRSLNASLAQPASIDPLRLLSNRRGLAAELAIALRRERRCDGPLAALLIDWADFEQVDERLGLAGGLRFCLGMSEQPIVGEAATLRECVRDLKACGLHVPIHDIGLGRSFLETLILLEPNEVRIAPRFVRGVARDAGEARVAPDARRRAFARRRDPCRRHPSP